MLKTKRVSTKVSVIAVMVLMILIVSSTLTLSSSAVVKESTFARPLSPATDYGNILQHDWPAAGSDEGNTGSNTGPAPEKANILWSASGASGQVVVFNGKAFVASGTTVRAYDAFTGISLYNSTAPAGVPSASGVNPIFKIDETYFLTQGGNGITVREIATGTFVANLSTPYASRHPGSGTYFGGHYSNSMKLYFNHAYDTVAHEAQIVAHSVADPTNPTVAWKYPVEMACELLCSGDGMVFLGTTEGKVVALNAQGQKVWEAATLGGIIQQSAMYYNHKLYTSAVSWQITCFNGADGEMLWQTEKGIRAFSAYRGAAGAGMIFESTVELDPYGTIGAWDAETGERLWMQPGYFNINYATYAYADGKVYGLKCDRTGSTGGLVMPGPSTSCWDAYTGTELWNLPGISFSTPSIAYGNLYGVASGRLYCIGGEPKDWTHGLLGTVENPRVAVGQQGPKDISAPVWEYQTGGDVYSSPAVVDGKVYFGSADRNLYCLDAYTGQKLWNFEIGHYLRSSPTVIGGQVYIGADDGYFYALNANTGVQIWKTPAGGFFPNILDTNEADARSSPVVVGDRMYAGALDGKVYCLNTASGAVQWTYPTGGPIMGTAAYSDNKIYITSTDGYLYALNAASGGLVWKSGFTLNLDVVAPAYCEFWNVGTPTVAQGTVYVGGGVQYGNALYTGTAGNAYYAAQGQSTPSGANGGGIRMFAFDAATGQTIWNISRAGNTQPQYVPAYFNGHIYAGEFFEVTKMDATNPNSTGEVFPVPDFSYTNRRAGNRLWASWVGYQISGSVTYADDPTGPKVYVGSDIGSVYCMNATGTTGPDAVAPTYSVFTAGGNVACSPTVWNGRMYIGTTEGIVYCFDDSACIDFNLWAASGKGSEMWNGETLTIGGRLTSTPMIRVWDYDQGAYVEDWSPYTPGLANAEIKFSLTKPDGTDVPLTATTDKAGYFEVSYTPTEVGNWGWVAYYEGKRTVGMTYNPVYSEWMPLSVIPAPGNGNGQPTAQPTGTAAPTVAPTESAAPEGFPMEYVYAIIAVIVIAIIAVAAYMYMKGKK